MHFSGMTNIYILRYMTIFIVIADICYSRNSGYPVTLAPISS